jgi:bifunctional ADP-heptose synthase (sugar kinase/adenylyltransferase)
VTGAGDTVISALAVMLAAGASLENAMRIANRAASIVVGKLGTATATPAELFGKA